MRRNLGRSSRRNGEAGYTLIELAITLCVFGLILAAVIPLYDLWVTKTRIDDTIITQKHIDQAMNSFKGLRGRYPCPARGNLTADSPNYGREIVNCEALALSIPPGTCSNGVCVENGARSFLVNGVMTTPRVIRGTVPFRTLSIPEDKSYDEYGGRFSYAVTATLTNKSAFRVNRGAIDIVDGQIPPVTVLPPPNPNAPPTGTNLPGSTAHYYIFSHGEDRVGAYDNTGRIQTPCTGPMYDNDNCNTSPINSVARYRHTLKSSVDMLFGSTVPTGGPVTSVNTHFDDFADFVGIGLQPLWEQAEDADNNLLDTINLHESLQGQVVVGRDATIDTTGPRATDLRLQIEGTGRGRQNNIDRICDQSTGDCMESALIGAQNVNDPRWLRCRTANPSAGRPWAGSAIANSAINCGAPEIRCDAGEAISGFDQQGRPVCVSFGPRCPSITVPACGTQQALPNNGRGGQTATITAGDSYRANYICQGGEWRFQNESGLCRCVPGITSTVSLNCGSNMAGVITRVTTRVCPSGQTTSADILNTCRCVPSVTTRTENCPAGQEGTRTFTRTVTCNGNTPASNEVETSNTCRCVPRSETRRQNCGAGFTGQVTQRRQTICPANTWGPWEDQGNNCACAQPGPTNSACGAGFNAGQITRTCTRTCNMSNRTYTDSCNTTNTCRCVPSTTVTDGPCREGYTGRVRTTTRTTCPGAVTTVETDDTACTPTQMTCTVNVIDNTVLSNNRQDFAAGSRCSGAANTKDWEKCMGIQYCHRTLGTGLYTTHRCACQ